MRVLQPLGKRVGIEEVTRWGIGIGTPEHEAQGILRASFVCGTRFAAFRLQYDGWLWAVWRAEYVSTPYLPSSPALGKLVLLILRECRQWLVGPKP